jgi:hypothetical protein
MVIIIDIHHFNRYNLAKHKLFPHDNQNQSLTGSLLLRPHSLANGLLNLSAAQTLATNI